MISALRLGKIDYFKMKEFDQSKFKKYGIFTNGSVMDNGEVRFRLFSANSSYIRTEAGEQDGWQNSHYHSEQVEMYIVEMGEILLATRVDNEVAIQLYKAGEYFSVQPGIEHCVKMMGGATTHCVKFRGKADWNPAPLLDDYLRGCRL